LKMKVEHTGHPNNGYKMKIPIELFTMIVMS